MENLHKQYFDRTVHNHRELQFFSYKWKIMEIITNTQNTNIIFVIKITSNAILNLNFKAEVKFTILHFASLVNSVGHV